MKVAIIGGSGKMGQWFAGFLVKDGKEVIIAGRNEKKLRQAGEQLGIEFTTSLAEAVHSADAVLLSVPMDSFEEVVRQLAPHLQPRQIVLDITSIKVLPVAVMHQYLKTGLVLGTHPMFGPGASSLANQNFVLTPTNQQESDLAQKIKRYLEARQARVTLMTPEEHDEMMTVILGLSHFIGIVAADTLLGLDRLKEMAAISGSTYKVLLTLAQGVISEDAGFYAALQMSLPGMTEVEELFLSKAKAWAETVKNKDRQQFIAGMTALKDKLEKASPDYRKAYENIYKLWNQP